MHRSEHLGVRAEVKSGEIEEGEEVAVADVEEVGAARVVTVLEEFRQREFEQVLVKRDCLLDVGGEQGEMVDATSGTQRAVLVEVPGATVPFVGRSTSSPWSVMAEKRGRWCRPWHHYFRFELPGQRGQRILAMRRYCACRLRSNPSSVRAMMPVTMPNTKPATYAAGDPGVVADEELADQPERQQHGAGIRGHTGMNTEDHRADPGPREPHEVGPMTPATAPMPRRAAPSSRPGRARGRRSRPRRR